MPRREVVPLAATKDALTVLGQHIRQARHSRGWTAAELAERAGVSERTVLAVESGSPGSSIGIAFNLAVLVGLPLFGAESKAELALMRRRGEEVLALLPSRVYSNKDEAPDADF